MSNVISNLPPMNPKRHPSSEIYFSNIPQSQRDRWKKQWAKMDEEECKPFHYKHYEWECRKVFEELEARERQLSEAILLLSDYRESHIEAPHCCNDETLGGGPNTTDNRCATCRGVDDLEASHGN